MTRYCQKAASGAPLRESELGADGNSSTGRAYADRYSPAGSDHCGQLGADNRVHQHPRHGKGMNQGQGTTRVS